MVDLSEALRLQRNVLIVDELTSVSAEKTWIEFKHNNSDPRKIGMLCSAISNSARLNNKEMGYILWGIEDGTKNVVGTTFDPDASKVGEQVLSLWLAQRLEPSLNFQFSTVDHPNGKVVMLEIPAATSAPVSYDCIPYIRIGSGTPKLTDYPDRLVALVEKIRPYTWETNIAKQFIVSDDVLNLLDFSSYFKLTKQSLPENKTLILERLEADKLIKKDVSEYWNITNMGALLFANDLNEFDTSLARKGIRLIAYEGKDRTTTVTHRRDGLKGYANGFEGLMNYISALVPTNEYIGNALRTEIPLFPPLAMRELIANALIHQDMTVTGAGPQIEIFSDRMEITNPGCPLVDPKRMIDLPPQSRNETIASLMRRMGLCEEQGSGLDKVIMEAELCQLPAPDFRANEKSMQVILFAPRAFSEMTPTERTRACYQHAVLKYISGERMKNATLCERFGIDNKNAAQATIVIKKTVEQGLIKIADDDHPRAGYIPSWA